MKATKTLTALLAIGVFLSLGGAVPAATIFLGGNALDAANWSNGIPAAGNPGTVAVDGSFGNLHSAFAGATITQTAGTMGGGKAQITTGTTWNLLGGELYFSRYLQVRNSTVNVSGGTVTATNSSYGTFAPSGNDGGTINISDSAELTTRTAGADLGGTIDIASGWTGFWHANDFSTDDWMNRLVNDFDKWTYNGSDITGAIFDATFEVTPDGKTLSMQTASGPIVPEPSTFLIWSLGLLGLAWYARSRRSGQ